MADRVLVNYFLHLYNANFFFFYFCCSFCVFLSQLQNLSYYFNNLKLFFFRYNLYRLMSNKFFVLLKSRCNSQRKNCENNLYGQFILTFEQLKVLRLLSKAQNQSLIKNAALSFSASSVFLIER